MDNTSGATSGAARTGFWLAVWTLIGLALTASLLALPLGLLLVPLPAVAWLVLALRGRVGPEVAGVGIGLALTMLLVAYMNRNYACLDGYRQPLRATSGASCGLDPAPWLLVGLLALTTSVLAYVRARTREG